MKHIVLLVLLLSFHSITVHGKSNMKTSIFLSNYTFSEKKPLVGEVKINSLTPAKIKSITVIGEHAAYFRIGKENNLEIIKNKVNSSLVFLNIDLVVTTSEGELKKSFRIVKDEFIKNRVIAHRGAWKNTGTPENSIASLIEAINLKCEGSEFDVHMTADSVPIINHDPQIQGISIAKSTSPELGSIQLSNGEAVPTLERFLKSGLNQNKTKLVLEIKASELGKGASIALADKVVKVVENLQAQAWVDYISFDFDVCLEIMKIAPYAKVSYLTGDKSPSELASHHFYGLDYHFSVMDKNQRWFEEARVKGLTVNVWTVNDEAVMKDLLQKEVDFITTNEPELLLSIIEKKQF